jgi:hypothetical protein
MVPSNGRSPGYTGCNLPGARGVDRERHCTGSLERIVFSCDYNGWTDVPEEEREALDTFEAAPRIARLFMPLPATPLLPAVAIVHPSHRRAA